MNFNQEESCSHLEQTAEMLGMKLTPKLESCSVLEDAISGLIEIGDQEALNGAKFMGGVYLGKIIKEIVGGEWLKHDDSNQLCLKINDSIVFPISAVESYISDPNENSLTFYANTVINQCLKR
ncbi:MAG: hypothetical protein JKY55_15570 [Aliivibrio sp.]|uniref:hypothetical protein n=1 Tax=Aliivibrio sp. TaxID=1872443 RepID=UPI001A5C9DDD|nr:hypothetical protein [Aliivibrio sp.]